MKGQKILIISNQDKLYGEIEGILSKELYSFERLEQNNIGIIRKINPKLIIISVNKNMPFSNCLEIRSQYYEIPILVISTWEEKERGVIMFDMNNFHSFKDHVFEGSLIKKVREMIV
ncbi:MAG: hypothetical protein ABID67_00055 [Candidatus Nealsonbacteria bacterium]